MNSDHEKNKVYDWALDTDEPDFILWEKEMMDEDLD